jgi:glycosyltransferase involved in cell wall biosynthesis
MDINLLAPICYTGYGVAGLNFLLALSRQKQSVALFPRGPVEVASEHTALVREAQDRQAFYNPQAPSVRLAQQLHLAEQIGRGLHCGFPIFELDRFTKAEVHHQRCMDRLLVCSHWAQGVLIEHGIPEEQIRVVPLGVDRALFSSDASGRPRKVGDTIFCSIGKFEKRKGQDVLLEAFNRAFEPNDAVQLIIHGWNRMLDEAANRAWGERFKQSKMGRAVTVTSGPLATQTEVARLMALADCGVFPARAEGWNLELLEMMAMGKTVIATDYSGHTEFVHSENCRLIPVDGVESAVDGLAFRGQGNWARLGREQVDSLVCHLREVHRIKQAGQLGRNEAGIETAREFSWDHAAQALVQALS